MTRIKMTLAPFTAALLLAACAAKSGPVAETATTQKLQQAEEFETQLVQLQSDLNAKEAELAKREAALDLKELEIETKSTADTTPKPVSDLLPPNPKPGECYARVMIPAKYKTTSYRLKTSDATERVEVIPAQYRTVTKKVLTKDASTRVVKIPAQYRTVSQQVVDKPAHTAWKLGPAKIHDGTVVSEKFSGTGEVMCLVEVPATYKTVTRRELVTPATTKSVETPAQYSTVQVRELVTPASERRLPIPAQFRTVTRTEKITGERLEWRRVLCEVNMTPGNIKQIQGSLQTKGLYQGPY